MRISGTEPSSLIISQKKNFQKLKRDVPNVPKQAEAKRDGVINPQNYNFKKKKLRRKILMLSSATNQPKLYKKYPQEQAVHRPSVHKRTKFQGK